MKRNVFWAEDLQTGKKTIVVVDEREDFKTDIYKIDPQLLSEEQIRLLFREEHFRFPEPHDHVVHDLSISSILPIYARVNRPDILDKLQKRLEHSKLSYDESNILFTEIDSLHRNVKSATKFKPDFREQAERLSQKIKQKKDINKLTPKDFHRLKEKISEIFDILWEKQQKERKEYNQECSKNYYGLQGRLSHCLSLARSTKEWGNARKELIEFQNEVKGKKLSQEHRQEIFKKIQEAFDTLGRRQKENQREYESECNSNFRYLMSLGERCLALAQNTTDWRASREQLKQTQNEASGRKLLTDQRERFRNIMNRAFEVLNQRANYAYEQRKKEQEIKHFEWQKRLRDNVYRLRESISKMESSIFKDQSYVNDLYNKKANVRAGRMEYEIRSSIQSKIQSIEERIQSKRIKLDDMRSRLRDMESKLD